MTAPTTPTSPSVADRIRQFRSSGRVTRTKVCRGRNEGRKGGSSVQSMGFAAVTQSKAGRLTQGLRRSQRRVGAARARGGREPEYKTGRARHAYRPLRLTVAEDNAGRQAPSSCTLVDPRVSSRRPSSARSAGKTYKQSRRFTVGAGCSRRARRRRIDARRLLILGQLSRCTIWDSRSSSGDRRKLLSKIDAVRGSPPRG